MDRNKIPSMGRGAKNKINQFPQDIFALGSKTSVAVNRDVEGKRNIHKSSTSDRKREASSSGVQPTKKPKLTVTSSSPGDGSGPSASLEVEPVDLVSSVLSAVDTHNSDKLLGLLTGAIRLLKAQRWKPDLILCQSLLYLAKIRPNMFSNENVTQSLCGLLKREQGTAFKSKGNPLVFVLACNLLYAGHRESKNWPDLFIKVYIEDALNERWWVDCAWCKCLVENITTAFNTSTPPAHLIPTENNALGTMSPSGSPLLGTGEEEGDNTDLDYTVFPRYSSSYETVEAMVLEAIKEQLSRRAAPDGIGKGFLKLLSATCGFPEIRMISAHRLEAWLHSGKLWRAAQELLAHVCCNAETSGPAAQRDHEVLAQLARMRLKTKPLVAAYVACLREMVMENQVTLRSVVTHTIYNELSNVRNPNNMAVLAALVQAQPQSVPLAMAETYQELLMRPEEFLRPLRALTREAARAGRADAVLALMPLCRGLAAPPPHDPPNEVRERAFSSIADLFCQCCMLSASHSKHLPDYRQQIAAIQSDGVSWLLETAMPIYRASHQEYVHALHKIMFLENVETYCKLDNWPPESERTLTFRMSCEVPLLQNTLVRIVLIGLSKELPLTPGEAFELVEQLVRRACALAPEDNPLPIDKIELAEYIFQLCQYHHPENITLPAGYTAPSLAITSLYWRAWLVLVMLAAHNPHTFARDAFHKYPTLKALIEMCITNKFTVECGSAEVESERAAVLQLEAHLAAASNAKLPITEHTSRLLSQLMIMEPTGVARRPPPAVVECLQSLCSGLRLGRLLCRQPALLLDIVQRHGTRRAMPWLHDLLHNSQHSLSVLPVQCLCEFLVAGGSGAESGKALELARHLQRMLAEEEGARAVLGYFLQRLAHVHAAVRTQANRGLRLVLTPIGADEPSEAEWNANVAPEVDTRQWLSMISSTAHWEALRETTAAAVRAACLADAEPRRLAAYLAFLTHHADACLTADHMQDLVLDLSQLIVERMTIMAAILPSTEYSEGKEEVQVEEDILGPHHTLYALNSIFHNYMQKVRMPRADSDAYEWCASQERVLLQWPGGEQCTVHILVVHAAVILLCYGPSLVDQGSALYEWWMSLWFSPEPPKAYLVDTSEEALLLPDWLRLRMVRSARPRLVQAGLRGLDAQQLALFIQSFGIPVPSMSALLSALDECPAEAVRRLAVERGYMAQLVAVQRARGAVAGERFSNTLNLQEPEYPEDDLFSKPPAKNIDSNEDPWAELGEAEWLPLEQVGPLFATAFAHATTFTGDVDAAFTTLQSILLEETKRIKQPSFEAADCPYIQCIVIYLGMILNSVNYYQFASGFLCCSMYSVPLVRLLLNCRGSPFEQSLVKVADSLLVHYSAASGPLIVALKEMSMLGSDGGEGSGGDVEFLKMKTNEEMKMVAKEGASKEELVRVLESCSANTLEQVGNEIISMQNTKVVIEAISLILEKNQRGAYEQDRLLLKIPKHEDGEEPVNQEHVFSEKGFGCGLLIDWMSELQPEILGDDPSLQMRLMFKDGGAAWRPLLATLLAHRASWRTLNTCITTLLTPDSGWRASSVLELVSALTQSPRVWQGRDKTTPKHHTPEDILHLNHQQLASLVTYILEEAATPSFDPDHACQSIEARLPLLLECCSRDDSALLAAMSGAERQLAAGNEAAKIFLLLFYMRVPKILQLLVDSCSDYRGLDVSAMLPTEMDPVADCSVSIVDKVSHCLFTALAAMPSNSKDLVKKAAAIESACRSLSRRHWRLAVRQLPLLAALLGGLTARLPSVIALHAHLLATLEAIPSHALFAPKHRKHVHQILDCYLHLAVRQGHAKEVSSLLHRTAALLRKYASAAPLEAHAYLQQHIDIVTSQPALSALLSGREGSSSSDSTSAGVVTTAPPSALPPPHALQLLQQRPPSMAPSDDLHWALQEVEAWGKRRGGAWGGSSSAGALLAATAPLSSHSAPAVRNSALTLLAKLLPAVQDTAPGFSAIMQCLDATQPDVALSALERLPDLVVGLQEHATQILLKVFDLGMHSKINTETYISKCVTVLNLHRGC